VALLNGWVIVINLNDKNGEEERAWAEKKKKNIGYNRAATACGHIFVLVCGAAISTAALSAMGRAISTSLFCVRRIPLMLMKKRWLMT